MAAEMKRTRARVESVVITLPGLSFTIEPSERFGANPRFYAEQVALQLEEAALKARRLIEAEFGPQHFSPKIELTS